MLGRSITLRDTSIFILPQPRSGGFDQSRETHPGRALENSPDMVRRRQSRDPPTHHRNAPSDLGHRTLYPAGERQSAGAQPDRGQARRMGFSARGNLPIPHSINPLTIARHPPIRYPPWHIHSVRYGSHPPQACFPPFPNRPTVRSTQSYAYLPPNKSWRVSNVELRGLPTSKDPETTTNSGAWSVFHLISRKPLSQYRPRVLHQPCTGDTAMRYWPRTLLASQTSSGPSSQPLLPMMP